MRSTAASCQVHSWTLSPGYACQHCHETARDFRSRAEDGPPEGAPRPVQPPASKLGVMRGVLLQGHPIFPPVLLKPLPCAGQAAPPSVRP